MRENHSEHKHTPSKYFHLILREGVCFGMLKYIIAFIATTGIATANPYLVHLPPAPTPTKVSQPSPKLSLANLKMMLPLTGPSNIFPTIKKVFPTGDRPMVVVNFKCPTELIGITPPPMMLLHKAIDWGFSGINKSNLLPYSFLQVCS